MGKGALLHLALESTLSGAIQNRPAGTQWSPLRDLRPAVLLNEVPGRLDDRGRSLGSRLVPELVVFEVGKPSPP